MLHFSAIMNWNASERVIETAFKEKLSIPDREKVGFSFNVRVIPYEITKFEKKFEPHHHRFFPKPV